MGAVLRLSRVARGAAKAAGLVLPGRKNDLTICDDDVDFRNDDAKKSEVSALHVASSDRADHNDLDRGAPVKEGFRAARTRLREKLLNAQFELAEQKRAAVLVNGFDGAGKGEVVNRLYDWLDEHFVETLSYGKPTEEEKARPGTWRYRRDLPAKGRIGSAHGRIARVAQPRARTSRQGGLRQCARADKP